MTDQTPERTGTEPPPLPPSAADEAVLLPALVLDEPLSLSDRPRTAPAKSKPRLEPEPVPLPVFGPEAAVEPSAPAEPVPPPAPTAPPPGPRGKVRLKLAPAAALQEESAPELITPTSIRGWSASIVAHVLALILLALIVLGSPRRDEVTIETRLPAGDPRGSEFGTELTGGLGIDEPLAPPAEPLVETNPSPSLLATPDALTPTLSNPLTPPGREGGQTGGIATDGTGQAGSGDGFGVAKFGLGGTESVNNVNVKVGNPQFTLIWDSPVDLDLHVLEPGGSHLYWQSRVGAQGGELDVDDVDGLGPENIYWGGGLDQGNGPPGEYKWYVHYYGAAGGVAMPTKWKVRIKHNGRYDVYEGRFTSFGQRSKTYSFKLDPRELPASSTASADSAPSETPKAPAPDARQTFERPPGPERDGSGWVVVRPQDGRFTAKFPDEPFVEQRAAEGSIGSLDLHAWTLDRGEGGYSITFADLPASFKLGAEATLDAAVRSAARDARGTTKAARTLTIAGQPAREAEIEVPDSVVAGGGLARTRVVRLGNRLYAATVTGTREFVERADTARFLDGFAPEPAR